MSALGEFAPGGYAFIPGPFQYSGGVVAKPGFAIERVRFARPVKLVAGFQRIAAFLDAAGRPLTALCACELHSPAPFTEAGFKAFNEIYAGTLARWGIFEGGVNPVARSNTCPEIAPPPEPGFHAFSFTVARIRSIISVMGERPKSSPTMASLSAPTSITTAFAYSGSRTPVESSAWRSP